MIIPRCDALSDKEKPGSAKPPGHRIPNKYISMNARSPNCAGVRAWLCLFFNFTNIACAIRDVKHIFGKSAFFDEDDLCAGVRQFRHVVHTVRFRQQSIHLREKNIADPTERSSKGGMPPLLIARREGPAFFDEDDLCAASETSMQPV